MKEKNTFSEWNMADYINTREDIIAHLEAAFEENDPELFLEVIGSIARSKGMTQIARELDIDRKGLYNALTANGNPSFKTMFRLFSILGLQLKLEIKTETK